MELKDIVLKKGDIIYFENGDRIIELDDIGYKVGQISSDFFSINDIIKIERPVNNYETIYEASEEVKEESIKPIDRNLCKDICEKIKTIIASSYGITVKEMYKNGHMLAWSIEEIYNLLDEIETENKDYTL